MCPLMGSRDLPQGCTLVSPVFPLSLHPLLSLISNCLKGSCAWESHSNLPCFSFGVCIPCCRRMSAISWHTAQSQEWRSEKLLETACQWGWPVLSLSAGLSG